jgi:hypothetical protein
LQDILLQRLQLNLPLIMDDEKLREDLFMLPREALTLLFSDTETCVSEERLFGILEERLVFMKGNVSVDVDVDDDFQFLKSMLQCVRLPLVNMEQLVSSVKFSGFFSDASIFEAL